MRERNTGGEYLDEYVIVADEGNWQWEGNLELQGPHNFSFQLLAELGRVIDLESPSEILQIRWSHFFAFVRNKHAHHSNNNQVLDFNGGFVYLKKEKG